jgi:hypothetical protein
MTSGLCLLLLLIILEVIVLGHMCIALPGYLVAYTCVQGELASLIEFDACCD